MTQPEHPDLLLQHHAVKQITRGGTQYADDMAMDAYWQALDEGKSVDEAGIIFSETYYKIICTSKKTNAVS